jgi:hypothetical protein
MARQGKARGWNGWRPEGSKPDFFGRGAAEGPRETASVRSTPLHPSPVFRPPSFFPPRLPSPVPRLSSIHPSLIANRPSQFAARQPPFPYRQSLTAKRANVHTACPERSEGCKRKNAFALSMRPPQPRAEPPARHAESDENKDPIKTIRGVGYRSPPTRSKNETNAKSSVCTCSKTGCIRSTRCCTRSGSKRKA